MPPPNTFGSEYWSTRPGSTTSMVALSTSGMVWVMLRDWASTWRNCSPIRVAIAFTLEATTSDSVRFRSGVTKKWITARVNPSSSRKIRLNKAVKRAWLVRNRLFKIDSWSREHAGATRCGAMLVRGIDFPTSKVNPLKTKLGKNIFIFTKPWP